jgi:hypothetical protein
VWKQSAFAHLDGPIRLIRKGVPIMKKLLVLFASAALMSGCAVYTPSGSVVVDPHPVVVKQGGGGGFCPPGQAKKGNC